MQIQIAVGGGASTLTLPMAMIKEVRMAVVPPEFAQAQKALEAKNYDAALTALKALEKFKGLPADWAQQAAAMLGDLYLEKGEMPKAEAALHGFPAALSPAQALQSRGRPGPARDREEGFRHGEGEARAGRRQGCARKRASTSAARLAYSQAFFLLGEVKEAEGDLTGGAGGLLANRHPFLL